MASRWQTFDPIRPADIPEGPGVYVIIIDGIAVYVGQSLRLRARIYSHKFRNGYWADVITPWGSIDKPVSIVVKVKKSLRMGDWAMWEIRLIHRIKPKQNTTHMKISGAK